MNNLRLAVLSASIMFVLTGCSSSGGGDGEGDAVVNGGAAQGDWIAECGAFGDELFIQESLNITDSAFARSATIFTDQDCTSTAFTSSVNGAFLDGDSVEVPGRGTQTDVNITLETQTETWNLQGDVDTNNTEARCGITNWAVNVSFDVSNCADAFNAVEVPEELFDIYLVSGNELFFGASDAGETVETRPTVVSPIAEFTRP